MNGSALTNEFAKMRYLNVGLIAAIMTVAVTALALFSAVSSAVAPTSPGAWNALLAGLSLAFPLVFPLMIAALASRQVDMEHQGNGWLLSATAGLTPGGLCRSKFMALGLVVAAATLAGSLFTLTGGHLLGFSAAFPAAQWLGFTACLVLIHLTLLALHVLLAARTENQLVSLGLGVLGTLMAVFALGLPDWAAHLTPWGYYALAQAADYQGDSVVPLPLRYGSVALLGGMAAALFGLLTGRFDRQEV